MWRWWNLLGKNHLSKVNGSETPSGVNHTVCGGAGRKNTECITQPSLDSIPHHHSGANIHQGQEVTCRGIHLTEHNRDAVWGFGETSSPGRISGSAITASGGLLGPRGTMTCPQPHGQRPDLSPGHPALWEQAAPEQAGKLGCLLRRLPSILPTVPIEGEKLLRRP